MMMKTEYLTTTQAATICHVTRFTIANWEKSGKLKTNKTAGGHRRILRKNLISFIRNTHIVEINKKDEEGADTHHDRRARIPFCWEFRFRSRYKHNCVSCLVFKERANKCFLTTREFGRETVKCYPDQKGLGHTPIEKGRGIPRVESVGAQAGRQEECLDCEYLNTYYPSKKKIIEKTKSDRVNSIRKIIHKGGEMPPAFFKKGLYTSGKYVASIEKAIFRKEKKRVSAF